MNLRSWTCVLLCVAFATVGFCAEAEDKDKRPELKLGPGDTVRILVYQNPDLTLETRVTENGTITYPLIGVIKVGGLTINVAETSIANALKSGGFIKQPQVTVLPIQIRSNQVSVLGQVAKPGRYQLETVNVTVSDMIAIAGGISATGAEFAILSGFRDGKRFRKEIDIAAIFLENRSQDDILVENGDVIYVDRAPVFYVYGEIQKPGPLRLERNMTVREALAGGGGPTARGSETQLTLYRRGRDGKIKYVIPDLNESVQPNDVLYVNESSFRASSEFKARPDEKSEFKARPDENFKAPPKTP